MKCTYHKQHTHTCVIHRQSNPRGKFHHLLIKVKCHWEQRVANCNVSFQISEWVE